MPAPDLIPQNPGDPTANTAPLASAISDATTGNPNATETDTANAQAPKPALFAAKHNGGGRWKIWSTANDDWFSDFLSAGDGAKAQAEAEADRLNAGGEPLVLDPQRLNEQAPAAHAQATTGNIDATTLKQAVMTPEGWLCPEPVAKG